MTGGVLALLVTVSVATVALPFGVKETTLGWTLHWGAGMPPLAMQDSPI